MRIILTLLLMLAGAVQAAAPVLSCSLSRTTGTAPLSVFIDCTGTTDADTTKPFHDLFYTHTFGDPSAGLWSYGANTNLSKNYATGAIAAHVYETAGTYTTTHTVTDGTSIARATNTITVSDPDTTYAKTATVCFYNSTVGTGCPSGATETASSDWDAAISSCMGTTKRCLFKRGDTFTASADGTVTSAGPNTIGAYGSGALPIVNLAAATSGVKITSTSVNDLRVMDIEFVGGSASDANQAGIALTGAGASGVTMLRVTTRLTGAPGIALGPSTTEGCTKCVIQDSTLSGHYSGYLLYAVLYESAVLGNSIGPGGGGTYEGTFRLTMAQKFVVAHNTVTQAGTSVNKPVLRFSALARGTSAMDTYYGIASDNKLIQGTSGAFVFTNQGNVGGDERIYDIIAERNWIQFGAGHAGGGFDCNQIRTIATRHTIRNNLFDMSTDCGDDVRAVYVLREDAAAPSPTDVNIYNNTFYADGIYSYRGVLLTANATNTVIKNNLCWFDVGTGSTDCVPSSGTSTTASNNTTLAQSTGTDPSFDGALTAPAGFRIGTGSYAATAGTALFPSSNDDFFHCDDNTSNERLGAFVSRTRATCRGSAGP